MINNIKQDPACQDLEEAAELDPGSVELLKRLVTCYMQQRNPEKAIAALQKIVRIQPENPYIRLNLGKLFLLTGDEDVAIGHLRDAVDLDPSNIEAHANLCNTLAASDKLVEAADCFEKAKQYIPDNPELLAALATTYYRLGMMEKACITCREVIRLKPDHAPAHSALLYSLNYLPDSGPEYKFSEHARWGELHAPVSAWPASYRNIRVPDRRLRIGYVSPNFYTHSVAFFIQALLSRHDRKAVETFCYANMDGADRKTGELMRLADNWRDIKKMNDSEVVRLVISDEIDILVDLAGHTADNRLGLFARKPAPLQVSYIGYPASTGMLAMDYRFTDDLADPPGSTEQLHTETLLRIPNGFLCYQPPVAGEVAPLPCLKKGYVTFGSFNNLAKINSAVIEAWSGLLKQVPGSRLLIKSKSLKYEDIRADLCQLFAAHGIHDSRIEITGWVGSMEDHLDLYSQVDIALDTFPYNGTTTTCESLYMGVPVVVLAGQEHVGRVGVSLLTHAGLAEFIADSVDTYIKLAASWAGNVQALAVVRKQLRARVSGSNLCDADSKTRNIERLYRTIWTDWLEKTGDT